MPPFTPSSNDASASFRDLRRCPPGVPSLLRAEDSIRVNRTPLARHDGAHDAEVDGGDGGFPPCIASGQDDQSNAGNCCSFMATLENKCCDPEGTVEDAGEGHGCSNYVADAACACVPPQHDDNGSVSNCCTSANGLHGCCITDGTDDQGAAASCCSGSAGVNGVCGEAIGASDNGAPESFCCTGYGSGGDCACVPQGTSDNGSATYCCSGSATSGVCN
jgi:hypothetical protein